MSELAGEHQQERVVSDLERYETRRFREERDADRDRLLIKVGIGIVGLLLTVNGWFIHDLVSNVNESTRANIEYRQQINNLKDSVTALGTQMTAQAKDFQDKSNQISQISSQMNLLQYAVTQIQNAQNKTTTIVTSPPEDIPPTRRGGR